ncbi:hypothetical protein B296_00026610 [Ensete ventricosum]|uniref:Uncharacterized protein n=1 Tax=Ensete ventricosum TaxID=4639 RepID=A0A426ZRA0_ENSVE|nr:hypothetical protein B296_00026610 [Ensete ventricosum]
MKVSKPGPRRRLQRPQAIRNLVVVSIVPKSPKLRRWTILGGPSSSGPLRLSRCWHLRWRRIPSLPSDAAATSSQENSVILVVRLIGGRVRFPRRIAASPLSPVPSTISSSPSQSGAGRAVGGAATR